MKIKILLSLLTPLLSFTLFNTGTVHASTTDCSWVASPVKDCVIFEGLGDLMKSFKGPGRYAVRYSNTAGWDFFNLYRATSYSYGSTISITDINGVNITQLYKISYGANSTSTGLAVGQVSSDVIFIYDVSGIGASREVVFRNACSWTGWC